jgi:hypothetical protein
VFTHQWHAPFLPGANHDKQQGLSMQHNVCFIGLKLILHAATTCAAQYLVAKFTVAQLTTRAIAIGRRHMSSQQEHLDYTDRHETVLGKAEIIPNMNI